jgi:uncharacterized protein YkwD
MPQARERRPSRLVHGPSRAVIAVVLLCSLLGAAPAAVNAGTADTMESSVATWINQDRAARGLRPLQVDARVMDVAGYRAGVMAATNTMSHTIPGDLGAQLRNAGVPYDAYGEAIGWSTAAWGDPAASTIYAAWKASPSHWAILMDPLGTYLGVGFALNAGSGKTFGTVIVTESPDHSLVTRVAGANRFATAAALSATMFAPGVAVAYIAYAYNYPDALAGAAASGALAGPVLLAAQAGPLDPATAAELVRLRPQRIIVLGGGGVIGEAVAWQLAGYATGP